VNTHWQRLRTWIYRRGGVSAQCLRLIEEWAVRAREKREGATDVLTLYRRIGA